MIFIVKRVVMHTVEGTSPIYELCFVGATVESCNSTSDCWTPYCHRVYDNTNSFLGSVEFKCVELIETEDHNHLR